MFKTDRLIYVQMPKTGCTHIALRLAEIFEGEQVGKHNRPSEEEIASEKILVSSIRSPWDWYLSLWIYGVRGQGRLQRKLLRRDPILAFCKDQQGFVSKWRSLLFECAKKTLPRERFYGDSEDVVSFRRWLSYILKAENQTLLGEGYGSAACDELYGFMTYRYLQLCCRNVDLLRNRGYVSSSVEIQSFDYDNCFIDYFIRQENLEDDLCHAIELVRSLSERERELIYSSGSTNSSNRLLGINDYYDDLSVNLVKEKEKLLVDKFGYLEPGSVD